MTVVLILACIVLLFLPPRFDPAIRLKERLMEKKK